MIPVELSAPAFLIAGLATSPHCALMCGGINAAQLRDRGDLSVASAQAWVNAGRIAGYAMLGAIAGVFGGWLLPRLSEVAALGRWLQLGAALTLVAIGGLQMRSARVRPECCVKPTLRSARGPLQLRLFLQGTLWAAMPCGVLYGVLLLASFSASVATGALLAGAFGLGTTPLLWASAELVQALAARRPQRALRLATGVALILIGLAATAVIALHGGDPFGWCATRA